MISCTIQHLVVIPSGSNTFQSGTVAIRQNSGLPVSNGSEGRYS